VRVNDPTPRSSDERLGEYDSDWIDDQVKQWDGNFLSDAALIFVGCERNVEIDEYRKVLIEHIRRRGI
jgi:hypothetical protein